ncbi:hypothetical protein PHYSODRAFT_263257 [Phytophthora sojae]|uniref:FYVE-type domain-containing protein n=1 Tax=Phytophthora sojae (strain P6497) TaxID=1094619 RepID=G5A4Q4_PHYSP|nr:hypothetical protein PHYSODRAFT_263257 [Phytophthora sojae]EGZ09654.1 hypothetical protein PHYSODRAFT_263257 [Phytophthora sojae]|eukprot:XP_009534515.1 hypothetical protein PHYSODRAFT_263257 [Phytophthora sojae]
MELSGDDRRRCQDLTSKLLERALHDCEELELPHGGDHAKLDRRRWRKLQSYPDVTMYADRNANSAWLPMMRRADWEHPVAVTAVGQLKCSLDDVLLALVTPNIATQRLRSFIMDRRPERNCQFAPIEKPTKDAPFRFLAVSRFVNTHNWPFTMFVGPQEMVLAVATGKAVSDSGRCYGYEMVQSVTVRCKDPQRASMLRGRILQARLFWEEPDGSVGVYNKLILDSKNRLADSVKQGTLCRAVVAFWKFVPRCIEMKKLRWCVRNKKSLIRELQSEPQDAEDSSSCAGCEVPSLKFRSSYTSKQSVENQCEFCERWLCGSSSCRPNCQLKLIIRSESGMYEQKLMLCPRCIACVGNQNAADIALADLQEAQQPSYASAPSFTKTSADWDGDSYSSTSYSPAKASN